MTSGDGLARAVAKLEASGIRTATLDAEVLLADVLGCRCEDVLAHPEKALHAAQQREYDALVERRARYEPVAYLTGKKEFYGRMFRVSPAVLIPRPETEHLVEAVLAHLPHDSTKTVVDVGTGSGNIAITLALERPRSCVTATDISADALRIAQENADAHHARVALLESDLLRAIVDDPADIVVANLPYLPRDEQLTGPDEQARTYEPDRALYADGPHGTRLLNGLLRAIEENDWRPSLIALEIDPAQVAILRETVARLLPAYHLSTTQDLAGRARVALIQPEED